MRSLPAFTLVGFVLAALPAAAQGLVPPAPTPAGGQAVLSDIRNTYDRMEQNIEMEYAKLKQEAKNNIDALNDKIKEIDKAIEKLKQEAERIELISRKIQELLPRILEAISGDPVAQRERAPLTSLNDRVAVRLGAELAKAGLALSSAEINEIVNAVKRGGTPAARKWTDDHLAATNKGIESKKAEIKSLKAQIAALEKEIAKLEQDKQKALASLRQQKQRALEQARKTLDEARKTSDARLMRLPTPTPAPKKTPSADARE